MLDADHHDLVELSNVGMGQTFGVFRWSSTHGQPLGCVVSSSTNEHAMSNLP